MTWTIGQTCVLVGVCLVCSLSGLGVGIVIAVSLLRAQKQGYQALLSRGTADFSRAGPAKGRVVHLTGEEKALREYRQMSPEEQALRASAVEQSIDERFRGELTSPPPPGSQE